MLSRFVFLNNLEPMKKLLLILLIPTLLSSCKKDDGSPKTETITKGSKWGIRIGSSHAEVYSQLQLAGVEKSFSYVNVVGQGSFAKPEDIQGSFSKYWSIDLNSGGTVSEYASISLGTDKVTGIYAFQKGSATFQKWPSDVSDDLVIKANDSFDLLYQKLVAIYRLPRYKDVYRISLSAKPLSRGFDSKMADYEEWTFTFFVTVKTQDKIGRDVVNLFFKNGKLSMIKSVYEETGMIYDDAYEGK